MGWRDQIDAYCASLPNAVRSLPAPDTHEAWRIGDKMFVCFGQAPGISVKCPDIASADMLRATTTAERAPYFHPSWIRLADGTDLEEACHRIKVSYSVIRAGLPKRLQATLSHWEAL